MLNKFFIIVLLILLLGNSTAGDGFSENWVDYDAVSKVALGTSQNAVILKLGEPLMVLADIDDSDNTIYLYYNYHIKSYLIDNNKVNENTRGLQHERITLLKFTFFDDALVSWEEDNMALGMSVNKGSKESGTFLHYFSLLLNVILLIKIL